MPVLKKLKKLPERMRRGYLAVAQECFFLKVNRKKLELLGFRLRKGRKKKDVLAAVLKGRRQCLKHRCAAAAEVEFIANKLVKVVRPRKSRPYLIAA